jgi:hypothetical protein
MGIRNVADHLHFTVIFTDIKGRMQKFPDWLPGARTANDTALCH